VLSQRHGTHGKSRKHDSFSVHKGFQTVAYLSNKTHNILKRLWCFHGFYEVKPAIEINVGMTSLTGDTMPWAITLVKIADFSGFKHCWKHLG